MTRYLSELDKTRRVPKTFGLVQKKTHLVVSGDESFVHEDHIDALTKGIASTKFVTELNLRNSNLDLSKAVALMKSIPKTLLELNLSKNPYLGQDSIEVIVDRVIDNPSFNLRSLQLASCNITDQGAIALARGLSDNTALRFLNLSNNAIREDGAESLANMLTRNETLEVLFLHWNRLGQVGGVYLANALQ